MQGLLWVSRKRTRQSLVRECGSIKYQDMNDILTSGTAIKQRIIHEIQNAKQSIFLAMAWFTDRDIATTPLPNPKIR